MDNANCLLQIPALDKFRGRTQVLRGIDQDIAPGERLALLGDNGAGKPTLIKAVLGREPDSAGAAGADLDPVGRGVPGAGLCAVGAVQRYNGRGRTAGGCMAGFFGAL
nr:ATP-binding cassette domain-containing protein [Leisingera sp.]